MAFIGYMRQSKDKEGGLSPDTQRAAIEHWASAPGKEREVEFLPPDLDWSGKDLNRPSIQEALRRVRAKEAEGLVVSKLDRLTRSITDLYALLKEAQENGWKIVALDSDVDFNSANGKIFGGLLGIINEWYLDRLREEQERTIRRKIKVDGAHWGVPFGYRRSYILNARGKEVAGPLVLEERWAPVVKEVFRLRAQPVETRERNGGSWGDLAKLLTEAGAPSLRERAKARREGREERGSAWRDTSVRTIIENRAYLGEARSGKIVKEGAHDALVDDLTFRRANRHGTSHPGTRNGGPLLSRILACGTCGCTLYRSGDGSGHSIYRCKAAKHTCPTGCTISARKIEAYLVAIARERYVPFEYTTADSGAVDVAGIEEALARIETEEEEVKASDASPARKAEALTALDVERDALLDELASAGQTTTRVIGPEYLGLVFQLRGDTPDLEPGTDWLDYLLDVRGCNQFLRETLGRVEVVPVGGAKTVPVEDRVRFAA
jgi:DNA invertase Pin-like site-specific DNA recombinase